MKTNSELNCDMVPLFELGSVHHKFYLINLRLPPEENKNLGPIKEIWAYVSPQQIISSLESLFLAVYKSKRFF